MATLFCTLMLTLHKNVLYAFHRGILRLHDTKPASVRFFYVRNSSRHARRNSTTEPFRGEP